MMTRFVLTLLVGLVVSLGALVSGVEPVLAKNWNTEKSLKPIDSIELSGGFIFYELPSYSFSFKCSQNLNGDISKSGMRVTEKKSVLT
jgi:hypothetical protein